MCLFCVGEFVSEFKISESLGLQLIRLDGTYTSGFAFFAHQVESLLSSGFEVSGVVRNEKPYEISAVTFVHDDTHRGLLINYKPFTKPKPVTKDELLRTLRSVDNLTEIGFRELIERIESAGVVS